MELMCIVQRIVSNRPRNVKLEQFKLRFQEPKTGKKPQRRTPVSEEEHQNRMLTLNKQKWLALVGKPPKQVDHPPGA